MLRETALMALVWLLRGIVLGMTSMARILSIIFFRYCVGVAGKHLLAGSSPALLPCCNEATRIVAPTDMRNDCFIVGFKKIRFV